MHRDSVLNSLAKIGLAEEALQCGTHISRDHESYKQLIREGKELTPVFSNCSGKHSGMLATAVHLKEDVAGYREIHHPVQQRILDVIKDICEVPKNEIKLSVDGCGAPVHQVPLNQMALGYARLAKPAGEHASALELIRNAMIKHPEMVGGKNRFDTDLMNILNGRIVSKAGAEAVQCIGLVEEGIGISIKVEDGGERAVSVAAMEVLKQLGLVNEQINQTLKDYAHAPVFNARNDRIGVIKPNFILEK
ncbi:asparaginase [Neobacillus drentensis]|uniref:asparaginase n=1 Tax=Neobacillus drentensis TaxID=220684 RepID=UPI00300314B5